MAGLFDGLSDPSQGGLMGMFANPQTAGLLGMAGGLLSASGPSRLPISTGQALGAGLQGMGAGFNNALQMQRGLYQMRMLQGLMGDQGGPAPAQSAPASASTPMPAVTGAANTGPLSGLSAGLGASAPLPSQAASSAASAYPASAAGGPIFGMTPQQAFQRGLVMSAMGMQGGGDLMKIAAQYDPALAAQMPTDITKMGTQAGWSPQQIAAANAGGVAKATTITGRPGGYAQDLTTGKMTWFPTVPQGGMPQFDANNQFTGVAPIPGATGVESGMAAAKAGGKAQYELKEVWDQSANGGKGGFVQQTVANAANAANGQPQTTGLPSPVPGYSPFQNAIRAAESGGNPAAANPASSAQGAMQVVNATAGNPGFGVRPAQNNSVQERDRVGADYAAALHAKYGNDADAAIAYHYGPQVADKWIAAGRPIDMLPPDARGYLTNVTNYSQAYAGGAKPSGPMAAQPPVGYTPATNAAQTAASKQMADSYKGLADSDASYQQSRGALNDMIALAHQMGPIDAGISKLPEKAHNWDSTVASYDKAHATFVSNQYNALSAGTDASKGTVNDMVPSSDKPLDTKLHGLNMQLNNLDYRHLETQLMTPAFQGGDQKAYTTLNAQFHNTVKPEMMPTIAPILQMNGAQQQAAVQAAVKANPALRPAFETLFNGGMLR